MSIYIYIYIYIYILMYSAFERICLDLWRFINVLILLIFINVFTILFDKYTKGIGD